jgi:hypothetical protein
VGGSPPKRGTWRGYSSSFRIWITSCARHPRRRESPGEGPQHFVVICPAAWIRYLKRFLRRDRAQASLSLPIFVLSFELGKSVWRHVHAAKVLVMHNILEGLQIATVLAQVPAVRRG